jgi:hypothetical protein
MLTFEEPRPNSDRVLTREDIARELTERRGAWAVVARPDRMARAETLAERINTGKEYGQGFAATVRKYGAEIRVYAQKIK